MKNMFFSGPYVTLVDMLRWTRWHTGLHVCWKAGFIHILGQNVTLNGMYVSGLALITGTKCHKKDIEFVLDNKSQMQGG